MNLSFTVYGTPVPQGSMRAFMRPGMKHPVITANSAKLKPWRQEIAGTALGAIKNNPDWGVLRDEPVRLEVAFYFLRPKSRRRASHHVTRPDADKLLRAVGDALTGVAFYDDSQIAECVVRKLYGEPSRTEVKISALETGGLFNG